jgi:hypothetical protein
VRTTHHVALFGRDYHFDADALVADEIRRGVELLAGDGFNAHTLRRLLLRHCDTLAPEGASPCTLISDLFANDEVRTRITTAAGIETRPARSIVADVSYGNLVKVGRYRDKRIELRSHERQLLCVFALWLGDGAQVGRGYDVFTTTLDTAPQQVLTRELDPHWTPERRELLKVLLRDGTSLPTALETAVLL